MCAWKLSSDRTLCRQVCVCVCVCGYYVCVRIVYLGFRLRWRRCVGRCVAGICVALRGQAFVHVEAWQAGSGPGGPACVAGAETYVEMTTISSA
jgi:hypothetical protein